MRLLTFSIIFHGFHPRLFIFGSFRALKNFQFSISKTFATDVLTHDRASLHNLHRINRANLLAGIAFDTEVSNDFMLFMRLKQNRFGWAFLRTLGTADTQIVDLIFDQTLTFTGWTFAVDVRDVFVTEIFQG